MKRGSVPTAGWAARDFTTLNQNVLVIRNTFVIHLVDEPERNGILLTDFESAKQIAKETLSETPAISIEAYPGRSHIINPNLLDWFLPV